jgi:hypothetical protein
VQLLLEVSFDQFSRPGLSLKLDVDRMRVMLATRSIIVPEPEGRRKINNGT